LIEFRKVQFSPKLDKPTIELLISTLLQPSETNIIIYADNTELADFGGLKS